MASVPRPPARSPSRHVWEWHTGIAWRCLANRAPRRLPPTSCRLLTPRHSSRSPRLFEWAQWSPPVTSSRFSSLLCPAAEDNTRTPTPRHFAATPAAALFAIVYHVVTGLCYVVITSLIVVYAPAWRFTTPKNAVNCLCLSSPLYAIVRHDRRPLKYFVYGSPRPRQRLLSHRRVRFNIGRLLSRPSHAYAPL